ncbi:MAG: hypothetical protein FJ130_01995 [Deltaproteobacteria bacterium]|nr:hypothetical protein [Deltaproteobacteria bacterium]
MPKHSQKRPSDFSLQASSQPQRSIRLLSKVYCLLFIVYCSLFIVHCLLFIVYCPLFIVYRPSSIVLITLPLPSLNTLSELPRGPSPLWVCHPQSSVRN